MRVLCEADLERFRTKFCSHSIQHQAPEHPQQEVQPQIHRGCEFGPDRCNYSHNAHWTRRCPVYIKEPSALRYLPLLCSYVLLGPRETIKDNCCPYGALCPFAHSKEEMMYHPLVYKLRPCNAHRHGRCKAFYCWKAHGPLEFRTPREYTIPAKRNMRLPSVPGVTVVPSLAAAAEAAAEAAAAAAADAAGAAQVSEGPAATFDDESVSPAAHYSWSATEAPSLRGWLLRQRLDRQQKHLNRTPQQQQQQQQQQCCSPVSPGANTKALSVSSKWGVIGSRCNSAQCSTYSNSCRSSRDWDCLSPAAAACAAADDSPSVKATVQSAKKQQQPQRELQLLMQLQQLLRNSQPLRRPVDLPAAAAVALSARGSSSSSSKCTIFNSSKANNWSHSSLQVKVHRRHPRSVRE